MNIERLSSVLNEPFKEKMSPLDQVRSAYMCRFHILLSYKMLWVIEISSSVMSVCVYYFLGKQVTPEVLASFGYGTSYLAFALVGISTETFLRGSIQRINATIRLEMNLGTWEPLLVSNMKFHRFFAAQMLASFTMGLLFFSVSFLAGVIVLKAPVFLNPQTVPSLLFFIGLMISSNAGIGIAAAGLVMIFKKGDPLLVIFTGFINLLCGVLYPVTMLPHSVQWVSRIMPYTYALEATRKILIFDLSILDPAILRAAGILTLFSVVNLTWGSLVFMWCLRYCKKKGITGLY